jgi:hypothetical protein
MSATIWSVTAMRLGSVVSSTPREIVGSWIGVCAAAGAIHAKEATITSASPHLIEIGRNSFFPPEAAEDSPALPGIRKGGATFAFF